MSQVRVTVTVGRNWQRVCSFVFWPLVLFLVWACSFLFSDPFVLFLFWSVFIFFQMAWEERMILGDTMSLAS
jgi:hypothetical protein